LKVRQLHPAVEQRALDRDPEGHYLDSLKHLPREIEDA
jgi:hypothetical protein